MARFKGLERLPPRSPARYLKTSTPSNISDAALITIKDIIIFDNRASSINGLDINDKGEGIATGIINGYQHLELGFSLN